eukprot:4979184-Pyramimonas_sp.AAC.1
MTQLLVEDDVLEHAVRERWQVELAPGDLLDEAQRRLQQPADVSAPLPSPGDVLRPPPPSLLLLLLAPRRCSARRGSASACTGFGAALRCSAVFPAGRWGALRGPRCSPLGRWA